MDTQNNILNLQKLIRILILILMEKSFYLQCSLISIFYNLSLNRLTCGKILIWKTLEFTSNYSFPQEAKYRNTWAT